MTETPLPRSRLVTLALSRYLFMIALFMLFFFLPAGTLDYWQAWVYMAIIVIPMFMIGLYLIRKDPALLERRMRLRERRGEQKRFVNWSLLLFVLLYLLPGFDRRFGWSHVPWYVVALSDVFVLLGYGLVAWVFRTNSYASRVVEVNAGQRVIDSGPYAFVRHPMYLGSILLWGLTPLALGSLWVLMLAIPLPILLAFRAVDEEKLLLRDLPGYEEYTRKVKYRLFPGIW